MNKPKYFLPVPVLLLSACASGSMNISSSPQWSKFICSKEHICIQYADNSSDFCFGGNFRASYKKTNHIDIWASESIGKDKCKLRLNSLIKSDTSDSVTVTKSNFD